MFCKIADLLVTVPAAGDLLSRCRSYESDHTKAAEIQLSEDLFRRETKGNMTENLWVYMESGYQFYFRLLKYNGLMLHSSAVEVDGKAYLFSADCGVGKSTHTRLWQQNFGKRAKVFNDDKPALRRMEDGWYAYGTPWCGKDGININASAPLAGVCFLKKAGQNSIRRLSAPEAMQKILSQTIYKFDQARELDRLLTLMERFLEEIPVYELENRPEPEAARLSFETMRRGAEEIGL